MNPIVVLCPTRDRPMRAEEMVHSFEDTVALDTTRLVLVVDDDDPKRFEYQRIQERLNVSLITTRGGSLVRATNEIAPRIWSDDCIIGHIGDDHYFRTKGWDRVIAEAEDGLAVIAPNDGAHQGRIPTACFLSSAIPRALGWFALPTSKHLYIDDTWRDLGHALGVYRYLPDVHIEHLHPAFNKAAWDDGYLRNNSVERWREDLAAYEDWKCEEAAVDVARVWEAITRD